MRAGQEGGLWPEERETLMSFKHPHNIQLLPLNLISIRAPQRRSFWIILIIHTIRCEL